MTTYRSLPGLIAMIKRTYTARGRDRAGVYSIEGTRLVERALRAGTPPAAVLIAEGFARDINPRHRRLLGELDANGRSVVVGPDDTLAELTEGRDLGQIIGLMELPPRMGLSDLPAIDDARLFLAAVDIADPGNVGALIRTAHAGGAAAALVSGPADPWHPRATRISRGSIFKMPIIQCATAAEMMAELRGQPMTIVGTAAGEAISLPEFRWPSGDTAILMGNEADGLPTTVRAALDHIITIPMPPGVDSYSVNAAAAIMLYAASQSLTMRPSGSA